MSDLNPEQKKAALHGEGPLLCLSGPGAGKTTALVARYERLLAAGVKAEEILAITFTRKAARQMASRIAEKVGRPADKLSIGTFHSIALAILRSYNQVFGELSERRVVSEGEMEAMIQEIAREKDTPPDDLVEQIERWKDNLITAQEAFQEAKRSEGVALHDKIRRARIYIAYQQRLSKLGMIDFGDILMAVVSALESNKRLRKTLQQRFRFIMVDEYQDINLAQDRMIRMLAGKAQNLWAVGDDDQAVYGFRGSDVRYIVNFQKAYPRAKIVRLVRNYRSDPVIVKAANGLIARNRLRLGKDLVSEQVGSNKIEIHAAATPQDEADWIVDRIEALVKSDTPHAEIAILVRVAHHANWIEQALASREIPFTLLGVTNFWTLPEVKVALRTIARVTGAEVAPDEQSAPEQILDELGRPGGDFVTTAEKICHLIARKPPKSATGQRKEAWSSAMMLLISEIRKSETREAFAKRVERREAIGERGAQGGVHVGTIHAAKGLEWDAVFLAACEKDVMPHVKADDLEEERRLCFVAITRPRHWLHISYSESRGRLEAAPSPYIEEIVKAVGAENINRSSSGSGSFGSATARRLKLPKVTGRAAAE